MVVTDLARDDMAEAAEDAFRHNCLVLATTTYCNGVFPTMVDFIYRLAEHNFQNRTVALMENGSWAPSAAKGMRKLLEGCKGIEYAENTVTVTGALSDASRAAIKALAQELAAKF